MPKPLPARRRPKPTPRRPEMPRVKTLAQKDADRAAREAAKAAAAEAAAEKRKIIEVDEEAIAKRQADTARFMADRKVQAEMEACRLEYEREQAAAAEAKAEKAKKRPGPAPRVDETGERIKRERQTRGHADLRTEAERQEDLE